MQISPHLQKKTLGGRRGFSASLALLGTARCLFGRPRECDAWGGGVSDGSIFAWLMNMHQSGRGRRGLDLNMHRARLGRASIGPWICESGKAPWRWVGGSGQLCTVAYPPFAHGDWGLDHSWKSWSRPGGGILWSFRGGGVGSWLFKGEGLRGGILGALGKELGVCVNLSTPHPPSH